jgi:hypothetical protein
MARKIIGYVVSVDVKYEEDVAGPKSEYQVVKDVGDGHTRQREFGWVDSPPTVKKQTGTETIYTQTVQELNVADIAMVVNGTAKELMDAMLGTLEGLTKK